MQLANLKQGARVSLAFAGNLLLMIVVAVGAMHSIETIPPYALGEYSSSPGPWADRYVAPG